MTELPVIGWREWVYLPALHPDSPIKAKVDTGARTSALHAFDLAIEDGPGGTPVASFEIHPVQRSSQSARRVEMPVTDFRPVRSSDGRREVRPVVRTDLLVGARAWRIDLTLTSRDEMGFRLLLGRTAIRKRFLVDPGTSYQQGGPK